MTDIAPKPMTYAQLKRTHAEYDLAYWTELRVLYEGGKKLLGNRALLRKIMPMHIGENKQHYHERLERAYYVNLMAVVIDFIVAGLGLDPVKLIPPGGEDAPVPPFYVDFQENTAPAGSDNDVPLHELICEQVRDGLLLGRWWTLVDMPPKGDAASEAEQIESGQLHAYAIAVPCEQMLNWCVQGGRLKWALRCQREQNLLDPADKVAWIVETYTVYTEDKWWRYVVRYTEDDAPSEVRTRPPGKEELQPIAAAGEHTFGRVPAMLHVLPVGLWAGNKLLSIVKAYFNKLNALDWAELKDALQQLYEFLGPEIPGVDKEISEAQTDSDRHKDQPRGPGYYQVRGADDRAEYVGPDTSGLVQIRDSIKELKQDGLRVTYQMALSEDSKGALIHRSAESKDKDHAATGVVLAALGREAREHTSKIGNTVAQGRGDEVGWTSAGLENFEAEDLAELVEMSMQLETVSIPSATYEKKRKLRLAKSVLRADATPATMRQVEAELNTAITQETLEMRSAISAGEVDPVAEKQAEIGAKDDEEDAPPGKKPAAKARK